MASSSNSILTCIAITLIVFISELPLQANVPDTLVKMLGRWRNDTYQSYCALGCLDKSLSQIVQMFEIRLSLVVFTLYK